MNKVAPAEFDETLARVTAWPPDDRLEFAQKVVNSVNLTDDVAGPTADEVINAVRARYPFLVRGLSAEDVQKRLRSVIGLAAGRTPPPSDEEVRRWIDEHRRAKHG